MKLQQHLGLLPLNGLSRTAIALALSFTVSQAAWSQSTPATTQPLLREASTALSASAELAGVSEQVSLRINPNSLPLTAHLQVHLSDIFASNATTFYLNVVVNEGSNDAPSPSLGPVAEKWVVRNFAFVSTEQGSAEVHPPPFYFGSQDSIPKRSDLRIVLSSEPIADTDPLTLTATGITVREHVIDWPERDGAPITLLVMKCPSEVDFNGAPLIDLRCDVTPLGSGPVSAIVELNRVSGDALVDGESSIYIEELLGEPDYGQAHSFDFVAMRGAQLPSLFTYRASAYEPFSTVGSTGVRVTLADSVGDTSFVDSGQSTNMNGDALGASAPVSQTISIGTDAPAPSSASSRAGLGMLMQDSGLTDGNQKKPAACPAGTVPVEVPNPSPPTLVQIVTEQRNKSIPRSGHPKKRRFAHNQPWDSSDVKAGRTYVDQMLAHTSKYLEDAALTKAWKDLARLAMEAENAAKRCKLRNEAEIQKLMNENGKLYDAIEAKRLKVQAEYAELLAKYRYHMGENESEVKKALDAKSDAETAHRFLKYSYYVLKYGLKKAATKINPVTGLADTIGDLITGVAGFYNVVNAHYYMKSTIDRLEVLSYLLLLEHQYGQLIDTAAKVLKTLKESHDPSKCRRCKAVKELLDSIGTPGEDIPPQPGLTRPSESIPRASELSAGSQPIAPNSQTNTLSLER